MELDELVSELVLRSDITFADPVQDWMVQNDWVVFRRISKLGWRSTSNENDIRVDSSGNDIT